jgi:hypothetical protein
MSSTGVVGGLSIVKLQDSDLESGLKGRDEEKKDSICSGSSSNVDSENLRATTLASDDSEGI